MFDLKESMMTGVHAVSVKFVESCHNFAMRIGPRPGVRGWFRSVLPMAFILVISVGNRASAVERSCSLEEDGTALWITRDGDDHWLECASPGGEGGISHSEGAGDIPEGIGVTTIENETLTGTVTVTPDIGGEPITIAPGAAYVIQSDTFNIAMDFRGATPGVGERVVLTERANETPITQTIFDIGGGINGVPSWVVFVLDTLDGIPLDVVEATGCGILTLELNSIIGFSFTTDLCPAPKGTPFTYQGLLTFGSTLIDGTCTFDFSLWDCDFGGNLIGGPLNFNLNVADGHFTVQLDFGNVYDGNARFLEITVNCPPPFGGPVTLAPRTELTPTPYALFAQKGPAGGLVDNDWKREKPDGPMYPIDLADHVGIGTSAPATRLHVNNDFGPEGLATFTYGGGAGVIAQAAVRIGTAFNGRHGLSIRTSNNIGGSKNHASLWTENVGTGGLVFYGGDTANDTTPFVIDHDGNVGIGTKNPAEKLHVCGNIVANGIVYAKEFLLASFPGCPDYVFERDYPLMALDELEAYIDREKHLPNIPSAAEVEGEGINLGEFQMRLLEKVEELVLYTLRQHKTITRQNHTIDKQAAGIADLSERLARMEALMTNLTIQKKGAER